MTRTRGTGVYCLIVVFIMLNFKTLHAILLRALGPPPDERPQ